MASLGDAAEEAPMSSDEEDDAFQEVDLDAEVQHQPVPVLDQAPRARMGASFPLPSPSLGARSASPLPPLASPPRSPAPLGRLGMATSEEEIDERPYWGRSASHSSTQTSSSRHTSSSHADEPTADPTFASTSTFDFAAAARATEAPDMAMVVSNDLEGTFESVSLSREATRPPSPRAAEKQRERPPPARARTPPPTVTVEPPPPAANGHAPSLPPPMKPTSKVTVPTTGRTALEKVLSKTRQRDLPPKERKEDNRHLKEYSSMMVQSRENEKRKEAMRRAKRVSKDVELSLHRPTWERGIVPNWKTVLSDPGLRRMWWDGSMPARFRANLWSACIGNALAIGKSSYARSLALAHSHLASGRLPPSVTEAIDADIDLTLRRVKLFQRDGPMHDDLRNLLLAYSVFHSPSPRYPPGASWPAALLLISMPVQDAFVSLANLVEKSFLKSFYLDKNDEMQAYYRVFGTLLADAMPPVYRNFVAHDVRPSLYLDPWLTTCFARFFPIDTAIRLFDVFLLEGDSFLFRAALAVLDALEARLFTPDPRDLAAVFAGTDAGARAVVARGRTPGEAAEVDVEDVYAACTGGEERIFERLRAQDWREGTWRRLVERELPE